MEKARSDELAKQAQWELEKLKLAKMHEAIKKQDRPIHDERVLALVDRSLVIVEQLSAKLAEVEKDDEPGDLFHKEISDLTNQLRSLVDQAQAERVAAAWPG